LSTLFFYFLNTVNSEHRPNCADIARPNLPHACRIRSFSRYSLWFIIYVFSMYHKWIFKGVFNIFNIFCSYYSLKHFSHVWRNYPLSEITPCRPNLPLFNLFTFVLFYAYSCYMYAKLFQDSDFACSATRLM
jgi:hypothetical protein